MMKECWRISRNGSRLITRFSSRTIRWTAIIFRREAARFPVRIIEGAVRQIVCSRCQEATHVPEDLTQAHCVRCGQVLASDGTPVATHITTNPSVASSPAIQPPALTAKPQHDRDTSSLCYTDWNDFRSNAPSVQRALMELATRPLPDMHRVPRE